MAYIEERVNDLSNVQYSSAEEDDDGVIEYIIIFSDVDGKFYKMQYKVDPTGTKYPNPWRTLSEMECVEVFKEKHIKYRLDYKFGKYWEYRQEDWREKEE